jgi:type I restriction enzyme S subunit
VLNVLNTLFISYSKHIYSNGEGEFKELKEIGELIMGQSPAGSTYNEIGDGMPFLQGNAEFGKIHPLHIMNTTAPNKKVKKDSILISVRAPVGDLNIADKEYCIGRGLAGIYIEDNSLREYIYNFLKFSRHELDKKSTGSTFKAINKDILASLKLRIPLDDIIEQNTIKLNTIIDSIKKLESKIASSKALQKSLINQIF